MKKFQLDLQNIKAAIFDMDGTMVDNNEFHKKAFQKFCEQYGFELTEKDFMKNYSGRSNKQLMPKVFGRDLNDEEIERYADEKEALYREIYADHIKPVEGLRDFIEKLQKLPLQRELYQRIENLFLARCNLWILLISW